MYALAGRPTLVCPRVGVHKRRSLMSSSLLFYQRPVDLACFTWMVFEMGGIYIYIMREIGRERLREIERERERERERE